MKNVYDGDSMIGYLAAIAPALLQLIAVVSIGLINVLRLDKFVLAPDFINIANFIVILISVSLISLSSFWDYNKISLGNQGEDVFTAPTKFFWKVLRIFLAISIIAFVIFVSIVLFKNQIVSNVELFTLLQWVAYITSMVSMSFIIYAFALLKIQERKNNSLMDNYIPRLLDSLRRYGHVKNPDIEIHQVNRNENIAIVKLGGESKFRVFTDFTGEMISIEAVK